MSEIVYYTCDECGQLQSDNTTGSRCIDPPGQHDPGVYIDICNMCASQNLTEVELCGNEDCMNPVKDEGDLCTECHTCRAEMIFDSMMDR